MGNQKSEATVSPSPVTEGPTRRYRQFRPVVGKVYRTEELAEWTNNPTRMLKRLVDSGEFVRLAKGMYHKPERNRYGVMPPESKELVGALVKHTPYVFTGPTYWNALGLGSTVMFPLQLVYNTKRSGDYQLGGRRFRLSRQRFPKKPTPEWFAVDLIEHRDLVGLDTETLGRGLAHAVIDGRLSPDTLKSMAAEYGTRETRELVNKALADVAKPTTR